MKKTAIVTGASSGIGKAISKVLCELNYEVYGFGRVFHEDIDVDVALHGNINLEDIDVAFDGSTCSENIDSDRFHPIVCDLLETTVLLNQIKTIRNNHDIHILVNNAGVGYYGLHEELNPAKIQTMVRTNLELPMLLTQQLLRELKKNQGYIFNISSITAGQSNPHGCAYGATKAGLASFSKSLFDETRKYGIKVINIQPDMTQTDLYRNSDFKEGKEPESYLLPSEVADTVRYVLQQRDGVVITEISIRPQIHRIRRQ